MALLLSSLFGYDTSYCEPPEESKKDRIDRGHIERLEYRTQSYIRGDTAAMIKHCYIYVPCQYDEDKAYDIVYFMHGANGNAASMVRGEGQVSETSRMLDYLISSGEAKPMLMVFSSYYEKPEDTDDIIGYENSIKLQKLYFAEFMNDLMPAVESKYSTYAKRNVTAASLISSREHRFISGYSAGGGVTWYQFSYMFGFAKWYLDFSGTYKAAPGGKDAAPEEIADHLENTIRQFLKAGSKRTDFYLYLTVGNETDKNYAKITSTFKAMMDMNKHSGIYSYGTDISVNNLCFCVSDHSHCLEAAVPHLYNALRTVLRP